MTEHQASRTLLKSPPELWAECSDPGSLARHLDEFFGDIRITRLEPEQAVAWEGERVSGTVKLEPSGWGTKVTLTATRLKSEELEPPAGELEPPADDPEPETPAAISRPTRMGFIGRLRYLLSGPAPHPGPEPVALAVEPEPVTEPEPATAHRRSEAEALLSAALDSLGAAHHRPFSRG